jgi:DDE domain
MTTRRPRTAPVQRSAFARFRLLSDIIVVAVRWYRHFGLSYHDVEELLTERGVQVDHATIYRWVQRFTPLLAEAPRPCRHAVGDRWLVDETYVRAAGRRRYVYRAIDQFGQVIDMLVATRRDACAAHRFFECAHGATKITPVEERAIDAADVSGACGLVGQSRPAWSSVRTTDHWSFGGDCLPLWSSTRADQIGPKTIRTSVRSQRHAC